MANSSDSVDSMDNVITAAREAVQSAELLIKSVKREVRTRISRQLQRELTELDVDERRDSRSLRIIALLRVITIATVHTIGSFNISSSTARAISIRPRCYVDDTIHDREN
ncbi:hypothetical protein B7463_g3154, partial [Scytalidium lignicola]